MKSVRSMKTPSFVPSLLRNLPAFRTSAFCRALLATLILVGGSNANASTNVLVNPGAENGLAGWHVSNTGYIYPVSTNALQGGAGSGHILSQSGANVFQLFDTTSDSAIIYQDFPAAA